MNLRMTLAGCCLLALFSCQKNSKEKTLFRMISPEKSGVVFNNLIPDNDTFNILSYEYIYNGGGVAIADFDNDGLSDLFFSGNLADNKLYQNKGGFHFEDVSSACGITAPGYWCSGVAVVDINQDGYKDLYICTNTYKEPARRRNLLFVNKMPQAGKLEFEELAAEYGIADTSYSTNSAFFDYDNDGDLDLFIINNNMQESRNPTVYTHEKHLLTSDRVDKLYRNDWPEGAAHPVYTDVSREAGITFEGYSLGLNICDLNQDGWKDIYVTNDFLSNDLMYINNQDGTFTNKASAYLKHTGLSAMGNDIADLNNDGLPDIVALDMLPESNYRKKTLLGPTNYTTFLYNERYGYMEQYIRNVLQVNQGKRPNSDDLVFSDEAMLAGIEATDWSWAPVIADFDRDGNRDLIITNGFPKDITDRDFMDYQSNNHAYVEQHKMLTMIPEVKIANYAYRNTGTAQFENVTERWGLNAPSFSNGAAYGDLDNDGDLDLVVNNINDAAFLYENTVDTGNYLRIELIGKPNNRDAIGATISYEGQHIRGFYEHTIYRGYLSSMDTRILIGLGRDSVANLAITWPDGKVTSLPGQKANQLLSIDYQRVEKEEGIKAPLAAGAIFSPAAIVPGDKIEDPDYIDYNYEPLLLHKLSQFGPGIAVGDANGDQLDDYYIPGPSRKKGKLYLQTPGGGFRLSADEMPVDPEQEELGAVFFDVDNDGDLDLYITCGSNQFPKSDRRYGDILLVNDKGHFTNISGQLGLPNLSSGCVRAADMDLDGDIDLFVSGRVLPGEYPLPASSYLLENKSGPDGIRLEPANSRAGGALENLGMVCDAIWSDYNSDGWPDLAVVGEWMPLTIFKNEKGQLKKLGNETGLENYTGWWNSIAAADFDQDGDMDYVATNFGENSSIRTSPERPVEIYAKDFDDNGSLDAIPFVYFKNQQGQLQKYSFHGRADLAKEMNKVKKMFTTHHQIGLVPMDSILSKEDLKGAYVLKATTFKTSYIENLGNGKFRVSPLPLAAQAAPAFGILADDFDSDGFIDILMVGNDHGVQPTLGRMDAMNGLFLKGDGAGHFKALSIAESGFYVPGNAKALASIFVGNQRAVITTQNNDVLLAFRYGPTARPFTPERDDIKVSFIGNNEEDMGTQALYYGNGFLSQSTRKVAVPEGAKKVVVTKYNGKNRSIDMK
ncbi:MAG: VCBS repeat-containing protein [Phaeodactylibacter sp.]|nr:VCBS repeat-containing protein [Phaeodactylibacter sp.]MCB9274565.1 VCBS repeat-containing protein [Lewinellaceae bacterium]